MRRMRSRFVPTATILLVVGVTCGVLTLCLLGCCCRQRIKVINRCGRRSCLREPRCACCLCVRADIGDVPVGQMPGGGAAAATQPRGQKRVPLVRIRFGWIRAV
jgi:hypothetical protein